MGNESTDGLHMSPNETIHWKNVTIITNISKNEFLTTISLKTTETTEKSWPKTSKYEKILEVLSKQNAVNGTKDYGNERLMNQTQSGEVIYQQKMLAMALPLALLGIFLGFVVLCHRFDTIRGRRRNKKRNNKCSKTQKSSETEQAVEELDQEGDVMLLKERHKEIVTMLGQHSQGKLHPVSCKDIGQHVVGRCMCKVEHCAHCLGYEAKKIQWKGKYF